MAQKASSTAEINARLWGARAVDWSEIQEGQCRAVYLAVFDRLNIGPGISYLDAGCGSGMAAQLAAERGASVSGLDATENLISIARTRVRNGDFHIGDLESLPFADNIFDIVTGFNAFQYSGNASAALAEAKRVTKPGARIIIMTWGLPEGMQAASLLAALKPAEVFDVDSPWRYPDLATALRGLKSSGVSEKAINHSSEEAVDAAHAAALARYRQENGSYTIGANFRCLIAHA